ncbi:hypothetical protein ACLOJK_034885, partial [Asimina triloba]
MGRRSTEIQCSTISPRSFHGSPSSNGQQSPYSSVFYEQRAADLGIRNFSHSSSRSAPHHDNSLRFINIPSSPRSGSRDPPPISIIDRPTKTQIQATITSTSSSGQQEETHPTILAYPERQPQRSASTMASASQRPATGSVPSHPHGQHHDHQPRSKPGAPHGQQRQQADPVLRRSAGRGPLHDQAATGGDPHLKTNDRQCINLNPAAGIYA